MLFSVYGSVIAVKGTTVYSMNTSGGFSDGYSVMVFPFASPQALLICLLYRDHEG